MLVRRRGWVFQLLFGYCGDGSIPSVRGVWGSAGGGLRRMGVTGKWFGFLIFVINVVT